MNLIWAMDSLFEALDPLGQVAVCQWKVCVRLKSAIDSFPWDCTNTHRHVYVSACR